MRSAFGRFAQELRLKKRMTQKDFSDLIGLSLAHVSNIEHLRTNVSDEVVGAYIKALDCTGEEAYELRKRASFANGVRRTGEPNSPLTPLRVMFEQFGDKISPSAAARIQRILEEETGERVEALRFSSNKAQDKLRGSTRKRTRPSLTPVRFAEICLKAEETRQKFCGEMEKLDVGLALERLCILYPRFDYQIEVELPSHLDGAFACILGHAEGHTIMIEERRFLSAMNGVHFARHVIAHELAHHFLHSDHLLSEATVYFPPQELAKNSSETYGSEKKIEQVVDTIMEVEAECFGTLLLVPWTAFSKGTEPRYLAHDYGEQLDEIKRYAAYFKNPAVLDAFKKIFWERGQKQHPIFGR